MTQERVRIGIVGAGIRLRAVLQALRAFGRERLIVTAVHDPLAASYEALCEDLGSRPRRLDTADAVCTSGEVDWVMIGSWNCFHAEQIIAAFEAGKDVFCEKPLATTLNDCIRLQACWRATGRKFFFGLVLRYSPIYQQLKRLVDSGVLGRLVSMEFNETLAFNHGGYIHGNWRRDRKNAGTHLLEKCCHDFDIVHWLTQSLPIRAASFGGLDFFTPQNAEFATALGRDAQGRPAYQTWPDPQRVDPFSAGSSIVDNQVAILQYAAGFRSTFHTNCNAALPERRVYLLGSHGAIRADVLTRKIEVARIGFNQAPEQYTVGDASGDHLGGDATMAEYLCRSMLEGAAPLASMDEAVRSAVGCLGVDQALDTHRIIDIRPLWSRVGITL